MSNHPRWGVHSQHDDITWLREIETCKVKGPDGYQYQPLWMNPTDAAARGIKNGDVVTHLSTSGAPCSPAPTSPSGSCPGSWASTTGPSTTPSSRARSTGAGPSTPSSRATTTSKNAAGHGGLRLPGRSGEDRSGGAAKPSTPRPSPANATPPPVRALAGLYGGR